MKRREFITFLGGGTAAWPLLARAQQSERVRRIGVLLPFAATNPQPQAWVGVLLQNLALSGWIIDRNIHIETRYATGNVAEIRKHAAELVAVAPDIIVAHGTAATGGTASSLLPDRHDSTRDKAPAHHSFSQGPRFFTIEWGLLCLSKWPRPATATDPVQPRVARIFAYGHSGEPVPVAPRAAPGSPAQDRNVALTCAFGAPGRIRTRDPLLRRYGRGLARRRYMRPDEQFFFLTEAGRGLR